jgi:hypothetical protein
MAFWRADTGKCSGSGRATGRSMGKKSTSNDDSSTKE